jgi:hypothetical protein
MVVRLRVASRRTQVLLAKWVAAWRAASSEVEGASTEAEAQAVKAWRWIDQLS